MPFTKLERQPWRPWGSCSSREAEVSRSEHLTLAHDNRPDRHVVVVGCSLRLSKRQAHEVLISPEEPHRWRSIRHARSTPDETAFDQVIHGERRFRGIDGASSARG